MKQSTVKWHHWSCEILSAFSSDINKIHFSRDPQYVLPEKEIENNFSSMENIIWTLEILYSVSYRSFFFFLGCIRKLFSWVQKWLSSTRFSGRARVCPIFLLIHSHVGENLFCLMGQCIHLMILRKEKSNTQWSLLFHC